MHIGLEAKGDVVRYETRCRREESLLQPRVSASNHKRAFILKTCVQHTTCRLKDASSMWHGIAISSNALQMGICTACCRPSCQAQDWPAITPMAVFGSGMHWVDALLPPRIGYPSIGQSALWHRTSPLQHSMTNASCPAITIASMQVQLQNCTNNLRMHCT